MEHRFISADAEGHAVECLNCGAYTHMMHESWQAVTSEDCKAVVPIAHLVEAESLAGDPSNVLIVRLAQDNVYSMNCKRYFPDSEIDGWVYFYKENKLYYIYRRYLAGDKPAINLAEPLKGEEKVRQLDYLALECSFLGIDAKLPNHSH